MPTRARRTEEELLADAKATARAHNMFLSLSGGRFRLFRCAHRPVFLGERGNVKALHTLVSRCAITK